MYKNRTFRKKKYKYILINKGKITSFTTKQSIADHLNINVKTITRNIPNISQDILVYELIHWIK